MQYCCMSRYNTFACKNYGDMEYMLMQYCCKSRYNSIALHNSLDYRGNVSQDTTVLHYTIFLTIGKM